MSCKEPLFPCLPPLGLNKAVSCSFGPLRGFSCRPLVQDRFILAASLPSSALTPLRALSSGLEALLRFARLLWPVSSLYIVAVPPAALANTGGLVLGLVLQLGVIQCCSLRSPRLQVLFFLWSWGASFWHALKGYRSVFPSHFPYMLPDLHVAFVPRGLLRSFEVQGPLR